MDKIIYFNEPFFQDGIIAQAVDQVAAEDVAYFSSAGNNADQSYESVFVPGLILGNYTFHDFNPGAGVDIYQNIVLNNGEFSPVFQGDQPFASDAAAGALLRQAVPSATNQEIYAALQNTALDMNAPGYDFLTGADVLEAGTTRILTGRGGNDSLIGGPEADTLTGGANFDTFSFNTPGEGVDTLTDFNPVEDLIQISASGFGAGLTPGETLAPEQFSLGALTPATRFIFNGATGQLGFDPDGSGAASLQSFAVLSPGLNLTEENILVV